jgi:Fe-S-cluster containining protein
VTDPAAGVGVDAGPEVAPLLRVLEGHLSAAQALAVSGAPPAAGDVLLRSLAMTGLLLGADDGARARRVEARAAGRAHADAAPFRLARETRFECGACGACCRTDPAAFGALTRAEMDRLAAAPFVRDDPALRAGPLFVLREEPEATDGAPRASFTLARSASGACVFLDASGRCRVHLELGPQAKPLGCQLFPFVVQPTSDGLVVADGLGCATFSTSAAAGPPIYERFDALRPLLREAARRARPLERVSVRLASGVVVAGPHARLALSRAVEVLDAAPGGWLAGASAALGALACHDALVLGEALEPGLAERVIDRLWTTSLEALAAGPDGAPGAEVAATSLARLLARVRDALAPDAPDLVRRAAARAAERGAPPALHDDALDAALRRALRQRLHGLEVEADGALAPGVAGALVASVVTAWGAVLVAEARGEGTATARDLDRVQPAVARALGAGETRAALQAGQADAALLVHGGAALATAPGEVLR